MCLGSYINRIAGDFVPAVPADNVLTSSDKLLRSCASWRKLENRSCGQPADRAHMLQSFTTAVYSHFTHTQPTHKQDKTNITLTPLTRAQEADAIAKTLLCLYGTGELALPGWSRNTNLLGLLATCFVGKVVSDHHETILKPYWNQRLLWLLYLLYFFVIEIDSGQHLKTSTYLW